MKAFLKVIAILGVIGLVGAGILYIIFLRALKADQDYYANELEFWMDSDGQTLNVYSDWSNPGDVLKRFGKSVKEAEPAVISISDASTGKAGIRVKYRKDNAFFAVKAEAFIHDRIWSRKFHQLFFLVDDENRGPSLWNWKPGRGFKEISVPNGHFQTLSLSLNQDSLVAKMDRSEDSKRHQLFTYSLVTGSVTLKPFPNDAEKVLVISKDNYLVVRHPFGNFLSVTRTNGNGPLNINGAIVDVTNLDGRVWALRHQKNEVHVVRLDETLTKVDLDIGVVH